MNFPEHVLNGLTVRQWKTRKRQQLKQVERALHDYRFGCAYCPGYQLDGGVWEIQRALDKMKAAQSVKAWGR